MSNIDLPEGETFDLDLGDDHHLQFFGSQSRPNERLGAVIYHLRPGLPRDPALWTPWCAGSVQWSREPFEKGPVWTLEGQADEHLTISPSVLCDCGDHGFIRNGKWVKA